MDCPACEAANPDEAQWCGQCYSSLTGTVPLMAPRPCPEPSASMAFRATASVTLRPMTFGAPLVYFDPVTDQPEARVLVNKLPGGLAAEAGALLSGQSAHHLQERHTCFDLDDVPLFYVERYRAVDGTAFAVFEPDGDPLASYVPYGDIFSKDVELRDGTGAPVARMHSHAGRLDMVETGGPTFAFCWREPCDLGQMVDDAWGLTVFEEPAVLDRRAVVAAPLVCRLLSRRTARRKDSNARAAPLALELASELFGGLFY